MKTDPSVFDIRKTEGVPVGDDPKFEDKWVRVARVSWFVLAAFTAVGATGLLGEGPLAHKTAGNPSGPLYLHYERFARYETPATLRLFVTPKAQIDHDVVRVFLSDTLVKTLDAQKANPHPVDTVLSQGGEILEYKAESGKELSLSLTQTFHHSGVIRGTVGLAGQQMVPIRQIIYP